MDEENLEGFLTDLSNLPPLASPDIWLEMWKASVNNVLVSSPAIAAKWADEGLADFLERFGEEGDEQDGLDGALEGSSVRH